MAEGESISQRFSCIDVSAIVAPKRYKPPAHLIPVLIQGIKSVVQHPRDGVIVLAGGGGVGKTALMANMFNSDTLQDYFIRTVDLHFAVRVNCFELRDAHHFDEAAFLAKLVKLASKVSLLLDDGSPVDTYEAALAYVEKRLSQNSLVILDNVYNIKLVEFMRQHFPTVPCCVITRDPVPLMQNGSTALIQDVGVYYLQDYSDDEIYGLLGETFEAKERVFNELQLKELARRCYGSPLVASLVADQLNKGVTFEQLLLMKISDLTVEANNFGKVSDLFNFSIDLLTPKERHRFYVFLFYAKAETVPLIDLAFLWGFSPENDGDDWLQKAEAVCVDFEKKSMLRRVSCVVDSPQTVHYRFYVNGNLYEAAEDSAKQNLSDCFVAPNGALMVALKLGIFDAVDCKIVDADGALLAILKNARKHGRHDLVKKILDCKELTEFFHEKYRDEILSNTFKPF